LPFYALGVGMSILLFDEKIAVLSILFLVFADPIASFVGVNFGRGQIMPNKSLEGTVAAFVTCNLLAIAYLYNSNLNDSRLIVFSIFAGVIGAISELASAFNIDDNLTIPVLSGAGLTAINMIFQVF
jgi:diacylglycerol kinase (CTP)